MASRSLTFRALTNGSGSAPSRVRRAVTVEGRLSGSMPVHGLMCSVTLEVLRIPHAQPGLYGTLHATDVGPLQRDPVGAGGGVQPRRQIRVVQAVGPGGDQRHRVGVGEVRGESLNRVEVLTPPQLVGWANRAVDSDELHERQVDLAVVEHLAEGLRLS